MKITKELLDYIRFYCNNFVSDQDIIDVLTGYKNWKWDNEQPKD